MTIYTSPLPPLDHSPGGNAAAYLRESPLLQANPDKVILIEAATGLSLTACQIFRTTDCISNVLRTVYAIGTDDVVALYANNSIYTPSIHYAVLGRGAIMSPANAAFIQSELKHQLDIVRAKLLITEDSLQKVALQASNPSCEVITIRQLVELAHEVDVSNLVTPEDSAVHFPGNVNRTKAGYYSFSSGTSGLPKCVVLTHDNMIANTKQAVAIQVGLHDPSHSFAVVLPLSHIYGLTMFVYMSFWQTNTMVIFPKFDLPLLVKCCEQYKINCMHAVPPMLLPFVKLPQFGTQEMRTKLASIKFILVAAAPSSKSLLRSVMARFPNIRVGKGYGVTESSPVVSLFPADWYDRPDFDIDSCGWLVPGLKCRVVDEDGHDCEPGQAGELWLKGPNVTRGYLNDAKANAESFSPDGYYKTGDVAYFSAPQGLLFIVDRIKELIKSHGHQVAPAELEAKLLTHPKVADVAVVGVPDPDGVTEYPKAYIVLQDPTQPKVSDEILAWFNGQVARHKQLWGGIELIAAVPKSASGKILRRLLREQARQKAQAKL